MASRSLKKHKQMVARDALGAPIEPALLGELRAAFNERALADKAVEAHNLQGQKVTRRRDAAYAVAEHFVKRLRTKLGLKESDTHEIDLKRGTVRVIEAAS